MDGNRGPAVSLSRADPLELLEADRPPDAVPDRGPFLQRGVGGLVTGAGGIEEGGFRGLQLSSDESSVGTLCGVDPPSEDAAARRAGLERWAEEQQRKLGQAPAPVRLRTRLVAPLGRGLLIADRVLDRVADRLLGRGLDTSGNVFVPEHEHPDRVRYLPSAWHVLPRALRYVGVSESDTFIDFGCGKGRVVHQAAKRPFRRVIGVEISPDLAEIARTGLDARRHQHKCRNVEIVVSDVAKYRVPDDLTIGYFFRPFKGETLDAVLRGIVDSIDRQPRRVRLIYVWPTNSVRSMILATEIFLIDSRSSRVPEHRTRGLDRALGGVRG
jgi:SAM-dependent methyltransferase